MIIAGAGGHAKELLSMLMAQDTKQGKIFLFDDVNISGSILLYDKFKVIKTEKDAMEELSNDPRFIIGVGNPTNRFQLAEKFIRLGGVLTSFISSYARIGNFNVTLGEGLNVMDGSVITEDVFIDKGTLIHVHASIHHDVVIGKFCEVLPGSRVLGHVVIGDYTSIGSGAVILPHVKIGKNVKVGAGAVVAKDVADGLTVKGVPAHK